MGKKHKGTQEESKDNINTPKYKDKLLSLIQETVEKSPNLSSKERNKNEQGKKELKEKLYKAPGINEEIKEGSRDDILLELQEGAVLFRHYSPKNIDNLVTLLHKQNNQYKQTLSTSEEKRQADYQVALTEAALKGYELPEKEFQANFSKYEKAAIGITALAIHDIAGKNYTEKEYPVKLEQKVYELYYKNFQAIVDTYNLPIKDLNKLPQEIDKRLQNQKVKDKSNEFLEELADAYYIESKRKAEESHEVSKKEGAGIENVLAKEVKKMTNGHIQRLEQEISNPKKASKEVEVGKSTKEEAVNKTQEKSPVVKKLSSASIKVLEEARKAFSKNNSQRNLVDKSKIDKRDLKKTKAAGRAM